MHRVNYNRPAVNIEWLSPLEKQKCMLELCRSAGILDYLVYEKKIFPRQDILSVFTASELVKRIDAVFSMSQGNDKIYLNELYRQMYENGYHLATTNKQAFEHASKDTTLRVSLYRNYPIKNCDNYEMLFQKDIEQPKIHTKTTEQGMFFDERSGKFKLFTKVEESDMLLTDSKQQGLHAYHIDTINKGLVPCDELLSDRLIKSFYTGINSLDEKSLLRNMSIYGIKTPCTVDRGNFLYAILDKICDALFPTLQGNELGEKVIPYLKTKELFQLEKTFYHVNNGTERPLNDLQTPYGLYAHKQLDCIEFIRKINLGEECDLVLAELGQIEKGTLPYNALGIDRNDSFIYFLKEKSSDNISLMCYSKSIKDLKVVLFDTPIRNNECSLTIYGYIDSPVPISEDQMFAQNIVSSVFNPTKTEFYGALSKENKTMNDFYCDRRERGMDKANSRAVRPIKGEENRVL